MTTVPNATHLAWPDNVQPKNNRYDIPGVGNLVRVTHMLKETVGFGKEKLIAWNAKEAREEALDVVSEAAFDGTLRDVIQACNHDPAKSQARFRQTVKARMSEVHAGRRKMEKAGDIGSAIHTAAETYLRICLGQDLPQPEPTGPVAIGFQAFVEWFEGSGLTPVRMEQTVWNSKLGHAGTGDLFALNADGDLEYFDLKTSSGIYATHHLQSTAYIEAARLLGIPVVRGYVVRVPKSGPDLTPEIKAVGNLSWAEQPDLGTRTHEQLMRCVAASQALWDCFCETEPR